MNVCADDASLFIEVDDPVQSPEVSNRDLQKVKEWAKQWLVNFSAEKQPKLMTCSFLSNNHANIIFDGVALPETSAKKHLGLTLTYPGLFILIEFLIPYHQ